MALVADIDHEQRAEFENFVSAQGDRLLHAAYGMCGDWQHAEDLVQQVLLKVASRWSRITDNPGGYAYRCLARANIDRWRMLRRRPEIITDPTVITVVRPRGDRPPSDVDDRLTVIDALRALPPRQRAIVVLRYLQDLSEADTAHALGISVGAVKSGGARGLARLRTANPSPFQEVER
ncbi:MAG: SigE family RNA polymerase sigma factor [Jatrophihabitantaceae bacterium]